MADKESPLTEADPSSLDELYYKDPLELTNSDLDRIVEDLREKRTLFIKEDKESRDQGRQRRPKAYKDTPKQGQLSLDSLGLKSYGKGQSTCYGYMIEWRLKPESKILALLLRHDEVEANWKRAPYSISELKRLGPDADKIIRPYIPKYDHGISEHQLLDKRVAEAVIACLKTIVPERLLDNLEWLLVLVKLETSWNLVQEEEDKDKEEMDGS